ncbi:transcriptional regulator [Pedobacter sp. HMWF019]|uniref:helix-turn-helix domain-containing protein n=1 Tax=Pedobacter sp. HMWF019 TaxID=2056856 RepID=UPI000D3A37C7|nr:helix-turn-helix transcriptional regulator [Pedobacter sp. HMWF019]PTS99432.1 transcriptional regulator [Pedobacter sp. HMWF019]
MKTTGEIIKQLRLEKNMTQREVSKALKITGPALSKIENGGTSINTNRLKQIAVFFGVSTGYLLDEERPISEMELLKYRIVQREQEIAALQSKVIALYDEARALGKR